MKTFNQFEQWSLREGQKERKEEEEQLVHDIAMKAMKQNADRIGQILIDKLASDGIPDADCQDSTDGQIQETR